MNLQSIMTLVQNNNNHSDWIHRTQNNGATEYCHDDVNLRLSSFLIWKNDKITWDIELSYGSTMLSSAQLPVTDIAAEDRFLSALDAVSRDINGLLQARPGRGKRRSR